MSVRTSDPTGSRRLDSNSRAGVVRSLVLEFEQLEATSKNEQDPCEMLRMGAEHSSTPKSQNSLSSPAINSRSLVKQRVSQFDYTLDENRTDKKKRHKSTTDNYRYHASAADSYQRSKSIDVTRKEKDRYARSRQISPKIKEIVFTFDDQKRRTAFSNNSNNNSSRKMIATETPKEETNYKSDTLASIKTNQRVTARFYLPDAASSTLEESECTFLASKNKTASPSSNDTIRKKARSVKSLKKVFEGTDQISTYTRRKLARSKMLSDSDRAAKISDHEVVSRNKIRPNKNRDTDQQSHVSSRDHNFETFGDDGSCDNNTFSCQSIQTGLENVRKDIVREISEEFYLGNHFDADPGCNYTEDEFDKIEDSFQEMEQTIKEMKEQLDHSRPPAAAQGTDPTESTDEQSNNEDQSLLSKQNSDEVETYKVCISKHKSEDKLDEDEFGQRSFGSFDNISFTESYNDPGREFILTTVGAVEHRTLSENFPSGESLFLEDENNQHIFATSSEKSMTTAEQESQREVLSSSETAPADTSSVSDSEQNTVEQTDSAVGDAHDNQSTGSHDNAIENEIDSNMQKLRIVPEEETMQEPISNRSTLYSSTTTNSTESMERYSKAESDEGIEYEREDAHIYEEIRILENNVEIRKDSSGGYDRTIRTETIYDSFQNPRIAKVSKVDSAECISKTVASTTEEAGPKEALKSPTGLKSRIDYIIEELIDTEKKYIKHLEKVVWDYMPVITDEKKLPPSLIGKSQYIFGNIKRIYNTTRKFCKALENCGSDYEEVAKTFLDFKDLFELYPLYSKNKPMADQYLLGDFKDLVAVRQKQLNDRLGLASNLLTPIQRLGKYILFLQQMQKELVRKQGFSSDNIYKAIEAVRRQMSRGNDYIAIDSIKDSPISLLEQGSFLMREKFNVIKPRKYVAMLFLFEEILVFTTVDPRNPEMFVYRESIKLNEMGIVTFEDQPLVFHLKRFPSYKKGPKEHHEFVIEAKKNKDKRAWTEQIEKRLWEQLVKCKEEQRELHNNQGKRNSVVELPNRVRTKKAGYSSLPSEIRKHPPTSVFYCKAEGR